MLLINKEEQFKILNKSQVKFSSILYPTKLKTKTMKRFIYLGYYLKKLDWQLYYKFLNFTSKEFQKSKFEIQRDILHSIFKYNISILEYFQFGFVSKSHKERNTYAGTGFMFEFQKVMNPNSNRSILENKALFMREFENVSGRTFITLDDLHFDKEKVLDFIKTLGDKVVLKPSHGGCGKNLHIIKSEGIDYEKLSKLMKEKNVDLAEEFVNQHEDLMRLSPSGLNTIRIITQVDNENRVNLIGARLRISVNNQIDNLAAGNIVTNININSGIVTSHGFYSDITKEPVSIHPKTKIKLEGFKIPFWKESINLALLSAEKVKFQNKSVGWDIGISQSGPILVEGNHDWCKLVWQLPAGKGLKKELKQYLQ